MLRPEFTVRRIGERYDRAAVDALVERVLATANRTTKQSVTVAELRNAAFRTPLLGPGYSAEEVDDFLSDAEQWMPDRPVAGRPSTDQQRQPPLFTPVRLREGYNMEQVDDFVDRVMATVNGLPVERPVTPREIHKVKFTPVRLTEGYDVEEVDKFLDEAESWLSGG
ncbi:DivIVA domain-containing protein [Kribbella voronezhensis]|uniref:Cell wall synthesis protein Wag31 n=1 Tax=Kribbella voronezhensis TaxID=2512212 RepID=A0A4V3FII5_9ACTN|nr:DivIVA domain-containing protein [Kribbella voronezhensis]TDU82563.1 DivIVA domain-containing protein [Kribbella voronezhensis]